MRHLAWSLAFCMWAAQGSAEESARALVRTPDVRGLPSLEIDLSTRSIQKYALVIGNSDYDVASDLPNAQADAELVARMFREAGYVVAEHHNLSKKGFEAALRQTLYEMDFGAEFAFFYAGHGVQIGDGNYLIPTDLSEGSIHDVRMGTVSLASIMGLFSSRSRSVLAVLDSCRNNPFPELEAVVSLNATPAPLQTGFAAPSSPINSLVLFSTSPGSLAFDGEGDHSPFTQAFVDTVRDNPMEPVDELMKTIRREVYVATQKLQIPWSSSSLVEPIVLGATSTPVGLANSGTTPFSVAQLRQLSSRLDRKVDVSSVADVGPEADGLFALIDPPEAGRLEMRQGATFQSVPVEQMLPVEQMSNLVYAAQFKDVQSGFDAAAQVNDTFKLQVGNQERSFKIALDVNPCDIQAGDHLDPDSVGIARYPNEVEPVAALNACLAATEQAPGVARFHYQLGRAHLALKDLDAARTSFQTAAELGHVRAYHGLGTVELAAENASGGQGREAAPERARAFFLEGVKHGDPYAYHSLGLQMLKFPQREQDRLNGFELLSRSLELGHTFSMNALGLYFLEEDSAQYDPARGLRYLEESARRGDIYGLANLGFVALTGAGGTQKDLSQAEAYFRQAAAGGHPAAASSLGRMYVNSQIGGRRDDARAIEWYDIGMERGDAWGGANAAWIIANRTPAGYTRFDAAERAAKAVTMRNTQAADAALEVLQSLNTRALNGGAQQIMRDLGQDVEVDGDFGTNSRLALGNLETTFNRQFSENPTERLFELARLYWENTKFRVDLY